MGALVLSQILSPKGILIAIGVLIFSYLSYEAINFEKHYVALEKANVVLQQNLVTTESALQEEKKTAQTQEQIDQTTLNEVRQVDAEEALQISTLQSDTDALQQIKVTPNENLYQCVSSPYVSTILNRLRQRASSSTSTESGSTGDATTSKGINNSSSPTSHSSS